MMRLTQPLARPAPALAPAMLSLLLVLLLACSSEPDPGDPYLSAEGLSGVEDVEIAVDFGSVLVGDQVEREVQVGNRGPSSIRISAVYASVEGTGLTIEQPVSSLRLLPGDEASLTATFAPVAPGAASADFTFALEGASVPQMVAHLSGTGVAGGCVFEPAALGFGTAEVWQGVERQLRIRNESAMGWSIVVGQPAGDAVFRLPDRPSALAVPPGGGVIVRVELLAASTGGYHGELVFSGKPACARTRIPMSAMVVDSTLTWGPVPIEIGGVVVGQAQTRTLTVTNDGNDPVTLTSVAVTSATGAFTSGLSDPTAELVVAAGGGTVQIPVVFQPAVEGADSAELTMATTHPRRSTIAVHVTGTGVP